MELFESGGRMEWHLSRSEKGHTDGVVAITSPGRILSERAGYAIGNPWGILCAVYGRHFNHDKIKMEVKACDKNLKRRI